MTMPSPGSDPGSSSNRRSRLRLLRRIGIPIGIVTLAGLAGGAWYGWIFVNEKLAPLVESNLSESLKRPVKLGRVERFSLTSLRFGPSSVPATATDPDRATVQAVDVAFNPIRLLLTRNLNLDITLDKPDLYLEQAPDGSWISVQISDEEKQGPVKTELQAIRFKDAKAVLVAAGKTGGKAAPVNLSQLKGSASFFDQNQRIAYELTGRSDTGGSLKLNGETLRSPSQTNLQVQGQNFALAEIDRLIKLPVNLPAGRVNGNLGVQIRPNQKLPYLTGAATFEGVTLAVPKVPYTFTQAKGALQLEGTRLALETTEALFGKGKIPVQANGTVDFDSGFNIAARVKPVSLTRLVDTFALKLPVPVAGEVLAELAVTGALQQPMITGTARSTKPGRVDRVALSHYGAKFELNTATLALAIPAFQATPTAGGQVTGVGQVKLSDPVQLAFSLQAKDVPGEPIARAYNSGNASPITIGRVNAQAVVRGTAANPRTFVRWQAPEAQYAGSGEILIANGVTTLQNTNLAVAGGTVSAQARAADGRWQALVTGANVQLNRFSKDLRGLFSGAIALSGSLSNFSPANVRAQGQARLSQGVSVIAAPIDAQFGWDGQKVVLQKATAPGFSANGAIFAQLTGTPAITALDLNVRTTNYSLQAIALPIPQTVAYSGRVDFAGRLTGSPTNPNINGGVTLRQFVVNGTAFESPLSGSLRVAQGVDLNLTGRQGDRIALTLSSDYQVVAFNLKRGEATATGRTQGDLLLVDAKKFSLSFLNTPATAAFFPLSGELNGSVALSLSRLRSGDLSQLNANGQLTIDKLAIGTYKAERFGGRISLANGVATLNEAELRRGQSIFQLSASAKITGTDPQVQAELNIPQGQLQDVLELLQFFDLSDFSRGANLPAYGSAADLETVPVVLSRTDLINQIRRLAEIQTLKAQAEAQRQASPLPELRELKGAFSGTVSASGSLRTGISANFNLRGQDWQWGSALSAKRVVARGSFEKGVLTLLPLRFQSDQSLIAFAGQVGGAAQSGQLRVENIPVDRLTALFNLPIDVEGNLNATATISGNQNNPQVVGLLRLNDGVLNNTAVQQAEGNFDYGNARLIFDSRLLLSGNEPITLAGSIPQKLPFASVEPDNDQIQLSVNVKNEGLALLNLLNNQVAWVDGKGVVQAEVTGTLRQPIATGTATVENATLQARALPEPLKGVTGKILFDRDRLRVERVTGKFTRGDVSAAGVLPIFAPLAANDPDQQTPLAVSLNKVVLNLKGLYQGGVGGNVQVTGTALNPLIGGTIQLTDGQVLLAAAADSDAPASGAPSANTPSASSATAGFGSTTNVIAFNNLALVLGDRVRVVSAPLLSFVATGDLTINGTLDDLKPKGLISLKSGQVNLFTTQFTLARGYPQTAEFVENQGLDPNLDVRLITSVAEVTNSRLPTSTLSSEINDSTITASAYGSLQTVRIQAQVQGPASRLSDNLRLTSSPGRSETEIVSLLGAGFVNTLGRGDTALGIANLAGSALLSNIQGIIGNALGLSEFRLFPTVTRPDRTRGSTRGASALGLGAEASIDLTPSLSLSALKVLTSSEPTQFGLRYRLNDQLLLRGSSDFSGDSRAVVEYETRF